MRFWLEPSDRYVKVIDKLHESNPDFEFEEGKEYLITLDKPCKVHEKFLEPNRGEGICVDYYFGKPKLFTYAPNHKKGYFWIVTDRTGGVNVKIDEMVTEGGN